jgi:hypothetical protein
MGKFWHVIIAFALAACWPAPMAAQQATPAPALDHRKLIAENLTKLFSADAKVHNVAVSEMRQVPSPVGLTWGTCVRVSASSVTGKPIAPRTYVITFTRNTIAERRAASDNDCAGVKFEPLRAG